MATTTRDIQKPVNDETLEIRFLRQCLVEAKKPKGFDTMSNKEREEWANKILRGKTDEELVKAIAEGEHKIFEEAPLVAAIETEYGDERLYSTPEWDAFVNVDVPHVKKAYTKVVEAYLPVERFLAEVIIASTAQGINFGISNAILKDNADGIIIEILFSTDFEERAPALYNFFGAYFIQEMGQDSEALDEFVLTAERLIYALQDAKADGFEYLKIEAE